MPCVHVIVQTRNDRRDAAELPPHNLTSILKASSRNARLAFDDVIHPPPVLRSENLP